MPLRRTGAAALLLLAACGGGGNHTKASTTTASTPAPAPASSSSTPVGTPSPPKNYEHVVWVWMENHGYSQVIGNSAAPYETALAHQFGTATNYRSVGSPSLPNYIGATSGSTQGISDDDSPSSHALTVDNIFRQVRASGRTERSFQESMPTNCTLSSVDPYAVKHNPAAYYTGADDRAACRNDDVPFSGTLRSGPLPTFSFVTPNLCNDTHDCSVSTGDAWLKKFLPPLLDSPEYRAGTTAVIVMWDEDDPMPNIVISPTTPAGTVVSQPFDHYSLLRTTEELLGLPLLDRASSAASMRAAFHL
jgi:phospholipase C